MLTGEIVEEQDLLHLAQSPQVRRGRLRPRLRDVVPVERAGYEREHHLTVILTGRGGCESVDISWQRLHRRRTVDGV